MIKKTGFFIFFIFFIFQKIGAQTYQREINWNIYDKKNQIDTIIKSIADKKYIFFENATYPDPVSMIPYYFEIFPINYNGEHLNEVSIMISNKKFLVVNELERNFLNSLNEKQIVDNEYKLYKSQGKNFLLATIPVFQKNSIGYEKLASFTISIQEKGNKQIQKSTKYAIKTSSVLNSGNWVKVRVDKSGVYKISYQELSSYGLTNLSNVSVWGHGGKKLPYMNNVQSHDDLVQIPIYVNKGIDDIFNQGDYILFYAEGPLTWNYNNANGIFVHELHPYTKKINYFITTDYNSPLRIQTIDDGSLTSNYLSNYYDELTVFESNDTNLVKSGREWFGDSFDVYTSRNYETHLNDIEPSSNVKVRVRACARSASSSNFNVSLNQVQLGQIQLFPVIIGDEESDFVSVAMRDFTTTAPADNLTLNLTYIKPSPAALGWLDYVAINSRQSLKYQNKQLIFRDANSVGASKITNFRIQDSPLDLVVWDISNIHFPSIVETSISSGALDYTVRTDTLRNFIAFEAEKTYQVEFVEQVANQNIHGTANPDMVIVTHPVFIEQANDLANLHREVDGMTVEVFTTNQVYNEFSSGNNDVTAIRNMMRMFYKRSGTEPETTNYLLLFGDGSYDNLSEKKSNTNFILTYQSQNSISKVQSFVTDDFFGLLDDNEGEADGLVDIGIGRLPVSTVDQAKNVLEKIKQYYNASSLGDWNQQLCFIGDDEDGNLHMDNANTLADYVASNNPNYNVQKIFFDAYLQQSTSQGERYPDVTNAINDRVNNGALIVNYTGHGNEQWLSHEKVLMLNDVQSWRNFQKLPLFVTATCEFSRFDDYNFTSTGEWVLLSPKGGGIGLLSTTRLVYSSANFALNHSFISTVFDNSDGNFYRLGDVVRFTKNISGGGYNKRNFLLLADPALMLKYPSKKVEITHLNEIPVNQPLDTLKALSKIKITGVLKKYDDSFDTEFNGTVIVSLFDKIKTLTTLKNNGGQEMNFEVRENLVYKGSATVHNGQFALTFILPKDINYKYGNGRFSIFALSNTESAGGYNESIIVGGINQNPDTDENGPAIKIFLNDKRFVSGGISDPNPKIVVQLVDSSGINTTGNSIGHDLMATLTGKTEKSIVLNSYYQADVDSYQEGKAEFQLSALEGGLHKLKVKAWDIYNNSSEKEIEFTVVEDQKLKITHLLNYPNPFTERTAFYFEHNQPFNDIEVLLQIFSPSGKLVKSINYNEPSALGYRVGPIYWDGKDDFGGNIGRGVYFYKARVRTSNGKAAEQFQKLVILK